MPSSKWQFEIYTKYYWRWNYIAQNQKVPEEEKSIEPQSENISEDQPKNEESLPKDEEEPKKSYLNL